MPWPVSPADAKYAIRMQAPARRPISRAPMRPACQLQRPMMPRAVLPVTTAPARPAEQPVATAARPPPAGGAAHWTSTPNVLLAIRPVQANITAPRPANTAPTDVFPVPVAMTYQQTTSATWPLSALKVILHRPFKRVSHIMAAHAVPITVMERSNGSTGRSGYIDVRSKSQFMH